jgi:hypothetical protein
MKTHFSEEIEDTAQFNETAVDNTWQQKRLPRSATTLGEVATILVLGIAFFALLLLTQAPPSAPVTEQTFHMPARPIWINSLPYAPRDGHSLEVSTPLLRDLDSPMTHR